MSLTIFPHPTLSNGEFEFPYSPQQPSGTDKNPMRKIVGIGDRHCWLPNRPISAVRLADLQT